jgi:hypothetical protein
MVDRTVTQGADIYRKGSVMAKFDSREAYEDWKARKALKRSGRSELEKSDQEWAKTEPPLVKRKGVDWMWLVIVTVVVGIALYSLYGHT